jgi:hypothetical protein
MWREFWGEGARKTVLRRCAKAAPSAADLERLLARDDELPELPAPETVEPLPPRPTRQQFIDPLAEPGGTTDESTKSYKASEEHEPPGEEEEDEEAEGEEEDEPEAAEPFLVVGAHGDEQQLDTAEAAAEACRDAIEEAAKARADLGVSAAWDNNAMFIFDLRERGHDALADGLAQFYSEQLAAADAAALPATPMKARAQVRSKVAVPPAEPPQIEVIKPKQLSGRGSGWDWPQYAADVLAAAKKHPPSRMSEFRAKQAAMIDALRTTSKKMRTTDWDDLMQNLATYEREGTAAP